MKTAMFKWKVEIVDLMDKIGTTDAEVNALIDRIGKDKNLTEGQYRELMHDIEWGIY